MIVAIAVFMSYMLYSKPDMHWSRWGNRVLGFLRFLGVFLVLLLLLDPSVWRIIRVPEKAVVALAIDNSESVLARGLDSAAFFQRMEKIKQELSQEGLDVQLLTLSGSDSVTFNEHTTDLSKLMVRVEDRLEDQHLASIVLFSDGIYNRGQSPLYKDYLQPVYTVGMGDTIAPSDISISRTKYNKVAFKGNDSPVLVEVSQSGYDQEKVKVLLQENGETLLSQEVRMSKAVQEVEFLLPLGEEGLRHFTIAIQPLAGESTLQNNNAEVFMDVIDGKEKVLIVARAPHPDVKAINQSLVATDNYEVTTYFPTISKKQPSEPYDVVIYHGVLPQEVSFSLIGDAGVWYIINNETSLRMLSNEASFLTISKKGSRPDKVAGAFNRSFTKFKVDETAIFEEFPPLEVPFGDYQLAGAAEVLLYQKLGNVVTGKPLMALNDDGTQKQAILVGQDIWRWKLQEAAINDRSQQFDQFVTKTIQYLSVQNDKKQFRCAPRSTTFSDVSPVLFDVEVYNDIYERIYGSAVELSIVDQDGTTSSFDFVDAKFSAGLKVPRLSSGIYSYEAKTRIGDKMFKESGEFLVQEVKPEYSNLTADHQLLRNLAQKTNGAFMPYAGVEALSDLIAEQDFKPVLRTEETEYPLKKSIAFWLVVLSLFSAEWFLRKYWGGY